VVVPAFNEAGSIASVLECVLAQRPVQEVVVVDDASGDNTWEALQAFAANARVKLLRHTVNQGKGAALRTGFQHAKGDFVIVQDADLEYDPQDWPVLLEPIVAGKADACFGSRFLGGPHRVLYYWHSVGNTMLTLFSNMLTNLNLTDMETCYKAVRGDLARSLVGELQSDRFGFEPEITAKVARAGCRIYEIGISYSGRTYAEGKKIGWKDGARALWCVLKYNVKRS
jgi:glycosyltransferase involved in cell wall biosynthesis